MIQYNTTVTNNAILNAIMSEQHAPGVLIGQGGDWYKLQGYGAYDPRQAHYFWSQYDHQLQRGAKLGIAVLLYELIRGDQLPKKPDASRIRGWRAARIDIPEPTDTYYGLFDKVPICDGYIFARGFPNNLRWILVKDESNMEPAAPKVPRYWCHRDNPNWVWATNEDNTFIEEVNTRGELITCIKGATVTRIPSYWVQIAKPVYEARKRELMAKAARPTLVGTTYWRGQGGSPNIWKCAGNTLVEEYVNGKMVFNAVGGKFEVGALWVPITETEYYRFVESFAKPTPKRLLRDALINECASIRGILYRVLARDQYGIVTVVTQQTVCVFPADTPLD